jgi:DNA-binding CsgD family transcriptional regulator
MAMHLDHDVVSPTLIGRDLQVSALRRVLSRAREGSGTVALIVGEAGVGKTRLLRTSIEEARAAGFFVLNGACFEAERTIPYAPLLDLVRLFATTSSSAVVGHVLAPAAAELTAIFPELRVLLPDATPSVTADPESDRRRLFHALAQAITALARTQPVMLAFEEVHWSDDASLELIFHLARSHASQQVIIALTYRSEEISPRLSRLIADLERARLVVDLPVTRLGRDDVGAMLRAIFGPHENLGPEFIHLLHGLTEGNPFFVEETLKALLIAGDLTPAAGGGWNARPLERVRVPRTAVEAVRRRLDALSQPARDVASIAAVAGRRFDFNLLQSLTQHDERSMLALVKELITAQLVVEETADRFAFRHALTREAIYAELLARERVALHRHVADAIENQHADSPDGIVEALAYHSWEAGEWHRAAKYAAFAARHAVALSAPREAVMHLDRAFSASERAGIAPPTELYLDRGRANETLGEFQRANDDFEVALARARTAADAKLEWEATHALGLLWAARDYERAGEYRRDALRVARVLGIESLVARSLNRIGNWYANLEEPLEGLPYHQEALSIFERLSDTSGVAETVDLIAMSHHVAGLQRAAAAYYERSVELFTQMDDRRGLANALGILALCGPSFQSSSTTPAESARITEELRSPRAIRLAREIGWRAGESFLRFILGDCLVAHGEYDRALALGLEALAQAQEIDHLQWCAGSLRMLGALALDVLAPSAALERLEAAHQVARRLGSRVWIRWTAAPLAIARARTGSVPEAIEVIDRAARLVGTRDGRSTPHAPGAAAATLGERQLWLARAEIAMIEQRPETALQIVDARLSEERDANPNDRRGVPRLSLLRAQALTSLERFDAAAHTLVTAREQAVAQGALPVLWRIDAAAGHMYRIQRQRLEARRAFDSAREIVDGLIVKVTDDDLRECFLRGAEEIIPSGPAPTPSRVAKEAAGGLTKRERDVTELVAQGKANRVIAKELGIGERTVEGYVASALAKLDFTSRSQLAAWAVEKGIVRTTRTP